MMFASGMEMARQLIGVQIAQAWKWFIETVLVIVALNVRISILATA